MTDATVAPNAMAAAFLDECARSPEAPWAWSPAAVRERGHSRERVLDAARALRALGVPPGTLAGLVLAPSPSGVEALVAMWYAGLVPILMDPALPAGADRRVAERLGAGLCWRPDGQWEAELRVDDELRLAEGGARRLPGAAAVKLTSGSTGAPRGVVASAAALEADTRALVACMELTREDRSLVAVPLSHSYGFSVLAVPALAHAVPLLFPGELGVLAAARELEATFLPSVPAWFQSVLRSAEPGDLADSLRLLVSAGAPLAPDVARAFRRRFGRPIHVLYGASECGSITFDREGTAAERGRVGTPLDGVRVELLQRAADDEPGVVSVRSPAVASGFLTAAGEDASRGASSSRLTGGAFRSEDLACWRDGELELRGRQSDWIDVRGHKVDPREVEAVIARHPDVREVAVIGKPQPDGRGVAVRAVIACDEDALRFLDVREWCQQRLASYQLPRSVAFVRSLPRTERGKLDRARLLSF